LWAADENEFSLVAKRGAVTLEFQGLSRYALLHKKIFKSKVENCGACINSLARCGDASAKAMKRRRTQSPEIDELPAEAAFQID
jgi:hypothetical protein